MIMKQGRFAVFPLDRVSSLSEVKAWREGAGRRAERDRTQKVFSIGTKSGRVSAGVHNKGRTSCYALYETTGQETNPGFSSVELAGAALGS
ncbi:hypothetical protein ElyMa_004778300 [Elysia marginata]|uniref:Uncharacterized protein n=1 Tax=Elysia marginata TaxID=1093978 RepID=A0AAV4IH18_9GAST|nr:hypothetical protein ElyMa_004778300 [Elysia marginata]